MKHTNFSLGWLLFDLRLRLSVMEAQLDLASLAQQARIDLGIEASDDECHALESGTIALRYDIQDVEAELERTSPIHQQLAARFPIDTYDAAAAAISDVIALRYLCEFSYDCTINPEAVSGTTLSARLVHAEQLMFAALNRLTDDDVQTILKDMQDWESQGSFAVTTHEEVRRRGSSVVA